MRDGTVAGSPRGSSGRAGRLPEPAARAGAQLRAGKRVREDVRDAAAVAAFSFLSSIGIAVVMTLLTRAG